MGQKVNPIALRLNFNKVWDSKWYTDKNYAELLHEDFAVHSYLENCFQQDKINIKTPQIKRSFYGVVVSTKIASHLQDKKKSFNSTRFSSS